MTPVTDPSILAQLNSGPKPVTDPAILAELNGQKLNPWTDSALSAPTGLTEGFAGLVGMPSNALNAVGNVARRLTGQQPIPNEDPRALQFLGIPTSGQAMSALESATGGLHHPQTEAGKYAETVASFVPNAFGGEAGLAERVLARVVAPGTGAYLGGQLFDPEKHPYLNALAQTVGAIGGGLAATGVKSGIRALTAPAQTPEEIAKQRLIQMMSENNVSPQKLTENAIPGRGQMAAEAMGPNGVSMLSTLGRRPGDTGEALANTLTARAMGAPSRILSDYQAASGITPSEAQGNMQGIVEAGRETAAPLYKQAFAGGSIAPLQSQYEDAFNQASRAVKDAQGEVDDATRAFELAQGRQQGDNVYIQASARADARAAQTQLAQATAKLDAAQGLKESIVERLRQAQGDAASNAPGAVWNPRIQQFLNDPVVKRGIAHGVEIQRLEALAKGEPFNPTEIGIMGTDSEGSPILSDVPNMRLLDAGKRGLDAQLEGYRNPITRQLILDERGRAIDQVRKAYLNELDAVNPDYKAARGAASDYLSANSAFQSGGNHILNPRVTAAQAADYFNGLSDANKKAYVSGIANELFNKAQNARLAPRLLNTPAVQQKLIATLGPDNAQQFITGVQQEMSLAKSGARMMPGTNSITADILSNSADLDNAQKLDTAVKGAKAIGYALSGRPGAAAGSAFGAVKNYLPDLFRSGGLNQEERNALARLLMKSPQDLAKELPVNVPSTTPRSAAMLGAMLGR